MQHEQEAQISEKVMLFAAGFNPRWDCTFNFTVHVPELALLRFMVEDYDYTSSNDFLGQFTLPFTSLRTGVCVCVSGGGTYWANRSIWLYCHVECKKDLKENC